MGSIRFRLWWCHSEDLFVCFGAKPTERAWARGLPCDQKWRREGPREDSENQLKKEGRREQSAWDRYPEKDTVSRRRLWEDGSKTVKRWVSNPSGLVEVLRKIYALDSLQMHREMHKSVTLKWIWDMRFEKPSVVDLYWEDDIALVTLTMKK